MKVDLYCHHALDKVKFLELNLLNKLKTQTCFSISYNVQKFSMIRHSNTIIEFICWRYEKDVKEEEWDLLAIEFLYCFNVCLFYISVLSPTSDRWSSEHLFASKTGGNLSNL